LTATLSPTLTPLPTPLGGGGGQIAFASKIGDIPQIFIINIDGSGRRQVTNVRDGACQPDWSPDGTRLVFISPCDGNQEIYAGAALFLINVDGTGLAQLPSVFGGDFDPSWSPDGTKIAFSSIRSNGRLEIYVLNLEDQSVTLLSQKFNRDYQPDWSPDGKEILFVSERDGVPQIWVMSADGSNQRRVTQSSGRINRHPDWSPDQKRIIFTQLLTYRAIPQLVITEYGITPYQEYRMIRDQSPMKEGRFSPDGYWVAYEGWPAGAEHDIYVMTINGSERRPLYSDVALDFDPAWRPVP
jgi:Tol biopolymer transport system component